jgi:hypothetical protein
LDIVGFVPGIGAVADLANAGIYAVNGNYAMAGISVIAVVPGFGDAAKASKLTVQAGKAGGVVGQGVKNGSDALKAGTGAAGAAKGTCFTAGTQIVVGVDI